MKIKKVEIKSTVTGICKYIQRGGLAAKHNAAK
jgi:hypothetical protein